MGENQSEKMIFLSIISLSCSLSLGADGDDLQSEIKRRDLSSSSPSSHSPLLSSRFEYLSTAAPSPGSRNPCSLLFCVPLPVHETMASTAAVVSLKPVRKRQRLRSGITIPANRCKHEMTFHSIP